MFLERNYSQFHMTMRFYSATTDHSSHDLRIPVHLATASLVTGAIKDYILTKGSCFCQLALSFHCHLPGPGSELLKRLLLNFTSCGYFDSAGEIPKPNDESEKLEIEQVELS